MTAPGSFISAGKYNTLILAFLCSKVGLYFIYQNSDTTGAGDIMLNIQSLIRFPIPKKDLHELYELCYEMMTQPSITTQNKIDQIIYETYGFDANEIQVIENH